MTKSIPLILSLALLAACGSPKNASESVVSMQVVDRNGFSETISNKDRLSVYNSVDFLSSQPYEKVLRVFGKDDEGKSHSKLTSYHDNGGIWQYLEAIDGRAHGKFLEWHENGKVRIEAFVIEGMADLSERAQQNWIFDGKCTVWDNQGNLEAEFLYDKGYLETQAKYYFSNGKIRKLLPYTHGMLDGTVQIFNDEGLPLEQHNYKMGLREGASIGSWDRSLSKYQEQYREGKLMNGVYFDREGNMIAEIEHGHGMKALFSGEALSSLMEYTNGIPEGQVEIFDREGKVDIRYGIKDGKKLGEEWQYYPGTEQPKLLITWFEDKVQGMVKTWYRNGTLESQREMTANKKHGLSFAYYRNGDLMLMEEYENDRLVKGEYYRKGDSELVSKVERGDGVATLYGPDGHFQNKVTYERGAPVPD